LVPVFTCPSAAYTIGGAGPRSTVENAWMSSVETETVTILITDLVDSTGLASRVGPTSAETLRREHLDILRDAIAQSGGSEVKNLGDGLMVAFTSASSAVSCATEMQQRIEQRNRRSDEQIEIRIGVSMGDATLEEGDYFGIPVVEAARLCSEADGGQILAKALVRDMAGGREGHAFKPSGDFALKGLPEPVSTVEVAWEPLSADAAPVPVPPRLQEMPPVGFVGRALERKQLRKLVEAAHRGVPHLALISGEPGIGKTRLASYTALEARALGATILYGRCEEELGVPYGPWVEALRQYIEHAPRDVLRAHVGRHGGELSRLVAALAYRLDRVPAPRETDPDSERYLLWGAVAGLLGDASSEEPIVVVLDDLQWADKPTLSLLKHVVTQGAGMRALFIGTYRESELGRGHPLSDVLADLHREQHVERIALRGLDQPDVVAMMERVGGHELDESSLALSHELSRETDGNPFYIAEMLRHLLESGAVYKRDDGSWAMRGSLEQLGLPQSVREVVGRRVERLGEDAVKALSIAAVIGREFDVELLLRITEHSEDALLDLLDEGVQASVLTESTNVPGRFSFAHALINHTLYEGIGTTRRARFHRRVGEALEELYGADPGSRLSEFAYHWSEATAAVDISKAIGYARGAGERALAELAPDEALRWFTQALDLQAQETEVDPAERCDLLIGLGEAQRQVGQAVFRKTLLEASRLAGELADADRAARAALANNRGQPGVFGEVDEERVAALEQAVELDRFANPARCARLLSLQALELQFDPDHERRRALAEEAIALARHAGDPRTLAYVLWDCAFVVWAPDTLEMRRSLVKELVELAKVVRDPALDIWAAALETNVSVESGEFDRAEEAGLRCSSLADDLGQPTLRWFNGVSAAGMALLHGDLQRAEELAESALQLGLACGQADAPMVWGAQHFSIRSYQGRADEVVELLEQGVEANPRIPAFRAGLAVTYCWLGRTAEATVILDQAAQDGFDHVPQDGARTSALALYTDAAFQADAREAASILYALVEPWADQVVWNAASSYGHARMYLGMLASMLGWDERADQFFAAAAEFHERKGMLLWAARGRLAWAEALARRGVADRAVAEAARALALAREHGYAGIGRRAAALMQVGSPAK
jgi:class 3 adenylate cyclase